MIFLTLYWIAYLTVFKIKRWDFIHVQYFNAYNNFYIIHYSIILSFFKRKCLNVYTVKGYIYLIRKPLTKKKTIFFFQNAVGKIMDIEIVLVNINLSIIYRLFRKSVAEKQTTLFVKLSLLILRDATGKNCYVKYKKNCATLGVICNSTITGKVRFRFNGFSQSFGRIKLMFIFWLIYTMAYKWDFTGIVFTRYHWKGFCKSQRIKFFLALILEITYITVNTANVLGEWRTEMENFYETRGTRAVLKKLNTNSAVMITGNSGIGKTTKWNTFHFFLKKENTKLSW